VTFSYGTFGPPLTHTVSCDVPPLGSNGVMTFPLAVTLTSPVTTKQSRWQICPGFWIA
jgi:hypothetical protein